MQRATHSNKFIRLGKFLIVLPLLVIPFITVIFWALGGGQGAGAQANQQEVTPGLNLRLPEPHISDNPIDKMAYYDKAASDSAILRSLIKSDPTLLRQEATTSVDTSLNFNPMVFNTKKSSADSNEQKVYQRLEQLNAVLDQNEKPETANKRNYLQESAHQQSMQEQQHLTELMGKVSSQPRTGQDSEINQLNGMLEKILDIQHPERLKARSAIAGVQGDGKPAAVREVTAPHNITLLDTLEQINSDLFFGLKQWQDDTEEANTIEAIIHPTQSLVSGAVIKMRLLTQVAVEGHLINKGTLIYGIVTLNNERLSISVRSIRDDHSIYSVNMEAFDMDGVAGVYIPGTDTRDVATQSAGNALQSFSLSSLDASVGAQAASAGIETAKQLLTKKVRLTRVQVKAGYKVFLKNIN